MIGRAALAAFVALAGCAPNGESPLAVDLDDLGTRYAAAWSSQVPDSLASFYAADGILVVNGSASEGREAIRSTADAFMTAFPDMRVVMDSIVEGDDELEAVFHWTWTGTNTGPGGTGRTVDLQGYEVWTLRPNGLIAVSDGHFDQDEYRLQVSGAAP